ncbi:hypothetical protein CUJ84_Chr002432 [Rhizobium leguminosarum]|uniref:Uncharacterized protein n=1 Tax=Rhizobium leguminosarum TaxID=384 RepID=A0A2K9Z3G2_RHILE|nr:hypothetical protein CUJ84_Chr002432 [Rhizobium leguminosarum]
MSSWSNVRSGRSRRTLEHDAEKCERFSDDIMLYFFDSDPDSDFRPNGPKIIRIWLNFSAWQWRQKRIVEPLAALRSRFTML